MLGLCELTGCRRQALLAYFGETLPAPCGNCDNCLTPPETWNATEVAQKALSCVHRTGQRFGVMYLIDVLLGKDDERIRRFGHDRISTFGIGSELGATAWRGVFRQLIARGLLSVDVDGHGGLHLTDACRAVLRGETQLWLRREAPLAKGRVKRNGGKSGASTAGGFATAADRALWDALRELRMALAKAQNVPPYVVFHDATLAEMVRQRPQDPQALAALSGIGERKLAAYGEDFLQVIRAAGGQ
jgi:ATP-dependent DNA helicase RecQ